MWKNWLLLLLLFALALAGRTFATPWEEKPSSEVLRIGGDVTAPILLRGQRAKYTETAYRAGIEGTVTVEVIIDEQGQVASARIVRGLPLGLDTAALEAVKTWRFKPATRGSRPVSVYDTLTIDFILPRSVKPAPAPPAESQSFEDVLRVGGGVTAPVFLDCPRAPYTEVARRARVQGTVIVEAVIDEQGRVVNTHILKPLPMGLDKEAIEAVKKWRFKPATLKGKPVKVFYALPVVFKLPP